MFKMSYEEKAVDILGDGVGFSLREMWALHNFLGRNSMIHW